MRCSSRSIAVAVLALSMTASLARAQSRPVFNPEDLVALRAFAGGQPYALSPSGRWIAYVITDQADDWNVQEPRPTGHLYVQALGGAPAVPRTARFRSGRLTAGVSRSSRRRRSAAAR
jgi:hypothetical protein